MVDVPPLLMSGSGCPVTGASPTATSMLKSACVTSSIAKSHGKECREIVLASVGYSSCSEQQDDIEECHEDGSSYTHLFDDDGIDEVGEGLREKVAFYRVARTFAHDVGGGNGDVGMCHLSILVKVDILRRHRLCCRGSCRYGLSMYPLGGTSYRTAGSSFSSVATCSVKVLSALRNFSSSCPTSMTSEMKMMAMQ